MKAVRFHAIGSPEVLRVDDVDKPKPGPGQALVRVHVVGVNFADTLLRRGTYISQPNLPETPGYEAAGIVEEVGQGVEPRLVGQRVVALAEHCYAEYLVALAVRLYLGGAGAPRRYFAWGQAVRRAVLTVMLAHAVSALGTVVYLTWTHRLLGWLPAPPARLVEGPSGGIWPTTVWYAVGYAWIVVYVALILGHYRGAQVIAVLAIAPDFVYLLEMRLTHDQPSRIGPWAIWILLDLAPVLATAAFHRDAPPVARRPWLLALPAGFVLVAAPLLAVQVAGHATSLPDWPGLCCILVALACLVHAPRARSRRTADSGAWSLALLAAVAGVQRIASLGDYLHDPHMMTVGVVEVLVMAAAVALVAPDGARAQAAMASPPPYPRPGWRHDG